MLHDHILVFLSFRGYSNMQIITTTKQMAICIFTTGIFLKAYVTLKIGGRGITYNPPPPQTSEYNPTYLRNHLYYNTLRIRTSTALKQQFNTQNQRKLVSYSHHHFPPLIKLVLVHLALDHGQRKGKLLSLS